MDLPCPPRSRRSGDRGRSNPSPETQPRRQRGEQVRICDDGDLPRQEDACVPTRLCGWRRVTGYREGDVRTGTDRIDSSRIDFQTEGFVAKHGTTSTTRDNSIGTPLPVVPFTAYPYDGLLCFKAEATAWRVDGSGHVSVPQHPCKIPPRLSLRHLGTNDQDGFRA
jgi:hypothetical protein